MKELSNKKLFFLKKSGFTVVEMIVVLAIFSILAAAIVPTTAQYLPGIRLNGTARSLTADLRDAQERAVTQQNQYLIRFFPTETPPRYQLISITNSVETVVDETKFPANETVVLDNTIINNQIAFSPDGGPSSNGNITLTLNSKNKIINVSPAGFIKITL